MKRKMTVVRGFGRGKKIGIPTINCAVPADFNLEQGVYAGWVSFNGKKYPAAIHYGSRPVFGESDISFEAHLLALISGSIPKDIMVQTVCFIRVIETFSSVEAMISQIERDVAKIRQILQPDIISK